MLRIDPKMLGRLDEIEADLHTRRAHTETEYWLGEIDIDPTLTFPARQTHRRSPVGPAHPGGPWHARHPGGLAQPSGPPVSLTGVSAGSAAHGAPSRITALTAARKGAGHHPVTRSRRARRTSRAASSPPRCTP
ncbi:hypothetical protein ABZ479_15805 [Streptomyces sp. NPDC005722]